MTKKMLQAITLLVLSKNNLHGYGIFKKIDVAIKTNKFDTIVNTGDVYGALKKMEKEKLVESQWTYPKDLKPRKIFRPTEKGLLAIKKYLNEIEFFQAIILSLGQQID